MSKKIARKSLGKIMQKNPMELIKLMLPVMGKVEIKITELNLNGEKWMGLLFRELK